MSSSSDPSTWMWMFHEPAPSPDELRLYDLFASEFLYDSNAVAAATRCGFQAAHADEYGRILFQKPYVQRKIKELRMLQATTPVAQHQERAYDRQLIISQMRAIVADPMARQSARVQAGRLLAEMQNVVSMQSKTANGNNSGMMQIPEIADVSKWEETALAKQELLQHQTQA